MQEHPKRDIVNAYRAARSRLKLGRYERYLVEHIAARVERLLSKRDEGERAEDVPGGGPADERARAAARSPRAGANAPPVGGDARG